MSFLENHLLPINMCPTIGPEEMKIIRPDLHLYFQSSQFFNKNAQHPKGGSYRFVKIVDNEIVAAIQFMSITGKIGIATNAICDRLYRRKGYAKEILKAADTVFEKIEFSDDRTEYGNYMVKNYEENKKNEVLLSD